MSVHKLVNPVWIHASLLLAILPGASIGSEPRSPEVPVISASQRTFLSRVARRTVRDRVLGRKTYQPEYIPDALKNRTAEVIVRLRERGYLRAAVSDGPKAITFAVRNAAAAAAQTLVTRQHADLSLVNRLLIEIEVAGPPEPIPVEGDWTKPRAVDPFVEPGVHGLVLTGPRIKRRFAPSELFTNSLVLADALKRLAQGSQIAPDELRHITLLRFRTAHWYESQETGLVSLHRGLMIVPPDAVNPETLDKVIVTLADYMMYRQLSSGLFTYQYEPGPDRYSDRQNLVRQVGAVAAMSMYARVSGRSAARASADLGIRFHRRGVTPIPGRDDAAFLATADGRNKLGVTALFCLALAEHPDARRYETLRGRLIRGLLTLQQPSGLFVTAFPPAASLKAQDYFPGETLLALATHYRQQPDARILGAFHSAMSYYRSYFQDRPSPAFVPWQVQAYAIMAKQSKRPDYIDYVFELTDWLADKQMTPSNCPWPELWGGIAAHAEGRAGVATAAYLEGFADALDLARFVGDTARAGRYENVVRAATRFVMQLQVRPEEAYFMRSPRDAVGGIRTAASLDLLRIDHCQHALVGLIKARRVLFTD